VYFCPNQDQPDRNYGGKHEANLGAHTSQDDERKSSVAAGQQRSILTHPLSRRPLQRLVELTSSTLLRTHRNLREWIIGSVSGSKDSVGPRPKRPGRKRGLHFLHRHCRRRTQQSRRLVQWSGTHTIGRCSHSGRTTVPWPSPWSKQPNPSPTHPTWACVVCGNSLPKVNQACQVHRKDERWRIERCPAERHVPHQPDSTRVDYRQIDRRDPTDAKWRGMILRLPSAPRVDRVCRKLQAVQTPLISSRAERAAPARRVFQSSCRWLSPASTPQS